MTDDPAPSRPHVGQPEPITSAASSAPPVLVGVDGSPPSRHALDLAAAEAELRGCPLRVVYAQRPAASWPHARQVPAAVADPAALLAQVGQRLRERHAGLSFSYHAVEGDPVTVLVGESAGASLTVVGHRGLGGYAGLAAGSVSQQLLVRGHGTVVVARGPAVPAGAPVVVGVDAGAATPVASPVEFALAEAALRRVRVEALYAWTPFPTSPHGDDVAEARQAAEALSAALGRAILDNGDVGVKAIVEPTDDPAAALVAATRGAGLVVIGPHEGASLRHLQPGSVGAALLRESYCPVAVVHRPAGG